MIPLEWLNNVIRERDGMRRLLQEEEGSVIRAAYRLAVAKCLTFEVSTSVPTRREVRAAAIQIAKRVPGTRIPETSAVVADCEQLGLLVL